MTMAGATSPWGVRVSEGNAPDTHASPIFCLHARSRRCLHAGFQAECRAVVNLSFVASDLLSSLAPVCHPTFSLLFVVSPPLEIALVVTDSQCLEHGCRTPHMAHRHADRRAMYRIEWWWLRTMTIGIGARGASTGRSLCHPKLSQAAVNAGHTSAYPETPLHISIRCRSAQSMKMGLMTLVCQEDPTISSGWR